MKKKWIILLAIVGFFLVLGIGAAAGGAIAYTLIQDKGPRVFAAPAFNNKEEGVLVYTVAEGSAAADAGIVRGDIILAVGSDEVNSLPELQVALQNYSPGEEISLTVLHGDDLNDISVNLGETMGKPFLGVLACLGPMQEDIHHGVPFEVEKGITVLAFSGVEVTDVVENSPAATASIQVGDLIHSVNGQKITPKTGLAYLIRSHKPGQTADLEITHSGDELTVEVELAENPEVEGQAYLGIYFQQASPQIMLGFEGKEDFFNLPHHEFSEDRPLFHDDLPGLHGFEQLPEGFENALIIGDVLEGSPAESAGVQQDDLILELDGKAVEEVDSFVDAIGSHEPGDQITLTVFRDSEQLEFDIILGDHPDKPDHGYLGVLVAGFVKITIEGDLPKDFDFDLEKELKFPEGDA